MKGLPWFNAYVDAVDFAACLLQCQTPMQADRYAARTLVAYETTKGREYAEEVQRQAHLLIQGVEALREEEA
jgi:hypothetical protein